MQAVLLLLAVAVAAPCVARAQTSASQAAPAQSYPGRYPFTQADIDFITGMISHHAQAIIMAGWAPARGASKSVGILCARIINAQTDEITLMQSWLEDRKLPVPEAKAVPMKMKMADGTEMDMLMPGMLSDEQMKQLENSHGTAFDSLFLTYMIQHHKGAITMVEKLFSTSGAGQDEAVFKFASDVYADQGTEIERMQRMLASLQQK
jgi:uncharacterized protein (DUF305 family)